MKITIDTARWTTQAKLAQELKISRQAVNNRIYRKKLKTKHIQELDLLLVEKNKQS